VSAGGNINADIHQETHYHAAPREKPTGIPNNSPSGTGKFVGRTQALKDLHAQLMTHPSGVVAIVGMGGMGKSELAIQYASSYQSAYPGGICWINARSGDVLTQLIQYCQLQLDLGLPQELARQPLSLTDMATWYVAHWPLAGDVLIVLDDMVTLANSKPLLDRLPPRFRKLITSRDPLLDASFYTLSLAVLHPDDALELLTALVGHRIQAEPDAAQALCEALGYLPLGVELVGRYLSTHPFFSVAVVRQSLSLKSQQLMPQPLSMMANQRGVWAAFELSWEPLDEPAQQLAQMLSFFAPGDVAWDLVEQVMAVTDLDETALTAAKTKLYQQSLLQTADGQTLRLHPLVQEFFTAQRQQQPQLETWQQQYIQGLVKYAQGIAYDLVRADIDRLQSAIPHLVALLRQPLDPIPDDGLFPLFNGVTRFYQSQAIYAEAQRWAEQGLTVLQKRLSDDHPDLATWRNNLANLYSAQGRYGEAEPLYLKAIEVGQRTLGDDHPALATRRNNLATLYKDQGRYGEAEPLYLKAIEVGQRTLGDDHPDLATWRNNLALLKQRQRRKRWLRIVRFIGLGLLIGIAIHATIGFMATQNLQALVWLVAVLIVAGFLMRWHPT
jgi:tetratricopeptide (TPR) repeat protein